MLKTPREKIARLSDPLPFMVNEKLTWRAKSRAIEKAAQWAPPSSGLGGPKPMEIPKREVLISVPILLDARGAQPGKAVLVDRGLPGQEFFNGQSIAVARFLETQKPAANRSDNFSLAPDDPTPRILRRGNPYFQRRPFGFRFFIRCGLAQGAVCACRRYASTAAKAPAAQERA